MKIALIGYGKMGKALEQLILDQYPNDSVALKISDTNLADLSTENLKLCDVAIEFSSPSTAVDNIYRCLEAGVPVVVGTTGWYHQLNEVAQRCQETNGAVFYSPNFSLGVHIFLAINRRLAAMMNQQPQYDLSIAETHHLQKLDAPSGTAIKTAEVIMEEWKRKDQWQLAEDNKATSANAIPIIAHRKPEVPGTHTVTYTSAVDTITLNHEAHSRLGFAAGAIAAAHYLVGRKGIYQMKDMMGE